MVDFGEYYRSSVVLKGRRPLDPDANPLRPLPAPVSSKDMSSPSPDPFETAGGDLPGGASNGQAQNSKAEDHYGFLYSMSEKDLHYDPLLTAKKAREREQKWLRMLQKWDEWVEHKQSRLKERCRKGIPSSMRGSAWLYLSGARQLLIKNVGRFDELISKPDNDVVLNVIDKDLDRTFPTHVFFSKLEGQANLRNVLKAYAMFNMKTGYCQAMAPVAATLLMHMTPEESFWVLVQICEQYLPGYYSPGLHAFQIDSLILKHLLGKFLPDIKAFMDSKLPPSPSDTVDRRGLDPILYCTEWFMSLFSRSLPWGSVLRIWDMFFLEGPKVLFKVALAVLNLAFNSSKARKECAGFFELTRKLRNLPIDVTHERVLIPEILKYKISREDLHSAHIEQASLHFTEERVRDMEMQARRLRLHQRTPSVVSDAATSVISDIA